MPWRVDLAFAVTDTKEWTRGTNLCREAARDAPCDSGTGFGLRDMQFYYETRAEADEAAARLCALDLKFEYVDVEEVERGGNDDAA